MALLEADTDGVFFAAPARLDRGAGARAGGRGRGDAPRGHAAGVRGPLSGDAVPRGEELRAADLRRRADCARRGVALQPRRAVRRAVSAAQAIALHAAGGCGRRCRRSTRRRSRRCATGGCRAADVATRARLAKTPDGVSRRARSAQREAPYEALLAAGRTRWARGRAGALLPGARAGAMSGCRIDSGAPPEESDDARAGRRARRRPRAPGRTPPPGPRTTTCAHYLRRVAPLLCRAPAQSV